MNIDPDHDLDSWSPSELRQSVYQQWLNAKKMERKAVEARRKIEDELIRSFDIEALEGTKNFDSDGYKVKVTGRMNRKIDGDALQEIAAENGLSEHLGDLFRWKPEINAARWKAADESITKPLLAAITTTPGRPSFQITKEED